MTGKRDRTGRKVPDRARQDAPMRRFIENVPETEFTAALEAASDPRIAAFLVARADPAFARLSFSALCRRFQLTLQDVDEIWRKHQLHTGMIQMMSHVPQILLDVANDAKTRLVLCVRCDGLKNLTGENGATRICPVCEGEGKVKVSGDKFARDLIFETAGLTGKKSPLVAIQQNFGLDSGLEELLSSSHKLIAGAITVIKENPE